MNVILFLVPAAFALALVGLTGFMWALRTGQFDDPRGDATRILQDRDRPE